MAFAPALRGCNDLGHLVTPTFFPETDLFRMTYTLSKNEQKLSVGSYKKIQDSAHRILQTCDCKVRESIVANFELVL